jgi:hypothetical protein
MKKPVVVTEKVEIYRTLHELNVAFAAIVGHCDTLQQTGLFKSKAAKLFPSFTQELQAEFNQEFLDALHQLELDDWGRHGRVREKYLRGPEPKTEEDEVGETVGKVAGIFRQFLRRIPGHSFWLDDRVNRACRMLGRFLRHPGHRRPVSFIRLFVAVILLSLRIE